MNEEELIKSYHRDNHYLCETVVSVLQNTYGDHVIKGFGYLILGHSFAIGKLSAESYSLSSILTISRAQLEAFGVFYHLFFTGSEEEKQLRLGLWVLNGLKERQKFDSERLEKEPNYYKRFSPDELTKQKNLNRITTEIITEHKATELEEINQLSTLLIQSSLLNSIPEEFRSNIINYAVWDYNLGKVDRWALPKGNRIQSGIQSYSKTELATNTSIPKHITNELYRFLSMHTHNNYISILQNEQLNHKEFRNTTILSLGLSNKILTQFIICYSRLTNIKIGTITSNPCRLLSLYKKSLID